MKASLAIFAMSVLLACPLNVAQAQSQELPLGASMPSGDGLVNLQGNNTSLSALQGTTATAVIFWSNQCTWVDRYENRVLDLQEDFSGEGVQFVFINANDASTFPEESLDSMRDRADDRGYQVNYLRDDDASVAEAFGAARTPHVYLFDSNHTLVYVGTIDDSPGDEGSIENRYLFDALTALVAGQEVSVSQTKAFGCTIKLPN